MSAPASAGASAELHPYGDRALELLLPREDLPLAQRLARELRGLDGIVDCVAGWETVLLHLASDDPSVRARVSDLVRERLALLSHAADAPDEAEAGPTHLVDVRYDGPDLADVAAACRLSIDEVVRVHSSALYRVAVVGFLPGFAYLHTLAPELRLRRRATPRTRVPAGSVAIAEDMTAVYPVESPGGWHLLGQAVDVRPFDPTRSPPTLFSPGDRVRFRPVR